MEQNNIDQSTSITFIGIAILTTIVLVSTFFFKKVGQKVYINSSLEVSTDTILTQESRWYYNSDSTLGNIRVALYKDKGFSPYDVIYLSPDDFADIELKEGYNTIIIKTLDRKYPETKTKSRILQLKPTVIPEPKFSFNRITE